MVLSLAWSQATSALQSETWCIHHSGVEIPKPVCCACDSFPCRGSNLLCTGLMRGLQGLMPGVCPRRTLTWVAVASHCLLAWQEVLGTAGVRREPCTWMLLCESFLVLRNADVLLEYGLSWQITPPQAFCLRMNNRKKYCTFLPILYSVMQNMRHTHRSGIPVKILYKLFPNLHRTFPQPPSQHSLVKNCSSCMANHSKRTNDPVSFSLHGNMKFTSTSKISVFWRKERVF